MAGRVLQARGLVKSFGSLRVLRGVDLDIATGERYFLFGPNGAGKTTLVRVLTGLLKPDGGDVLVFGAHLEDGSKATRARIGVLSHDPCLYGDLTAMENLRFFGRLYDVPDLGTRCREMLKEVGLYARAHDRVGTFSRGMRQRLGLARALLHDPDLVLLDEPYAGLDLGAVDALDRLVMDLSGEGKAFLASTHDLAKGRDLASRAGLLTGGRIQLEAEPSGWDAFTGQYREVMGGGR